MKKICCYILISTCAGLTFLSCNNATNKDNFIIKGTIKGLGNNAVVLMDAKFYPLDTVQAVNDAFIFEHTQDLNNPKMQGVFLPQLSNKKGGRRINKAFFFIDSDAINITAAIVDENITDVNVTGSPTTNAYYQLDENFPSSIALETYSKPYSDAFYQYNNVEKSEENREKLRHYGKIVDSLFTLKRQNIVDAIDSNKESIALSYIVYQNFKNESPEFLKDVVERFSPAMDSTYYISLLNEKIKLNEATVIGSVAPDFTLVNQDNKNIKLSSFQGKYVIIDFWASWCGPCKREIPHLKEAYAKFNDKVEIVSVSIDDKKEAWQRALDKEKLPYVKLWDKEKVTQNLYQFQGIPYVVLVSPNGRILKINEGLRGDELDKTLQSLSL